MLDFPCRQDDEILVGVEQLALLEQLAGEAFIDQAVARTAGAVQHEHRIVDVAVGAPVEFAERRVMDAQLRQTLAGSEVEIVQNDVAVESSCRHRVLRLRESGPEGQHAQRENRAAG